MGLGVVAGVPIGASFRNRKEVRAAHIHRALIAGIVGTKELGAESIVASGGYEDDEDHGDLLIYTGQGGRDPNTGRQIADQEFVRGNAALVTSCLRGSPVRVVKGSTSDGYFYAGLYRVESYWMEAGRAGFQVCRYRLVRETVVDDEGKRQDQSTRRIATTISRIVRDTKVSQQVKLLNDFSCQVCGVCLNCLGGPYAEGAHVRPLGRPHEGPDVLENLLCLCANHHVLFDHGGFVIDDDYLIHGLGKPTVLRGETKPDRQYLAYHRALWAKAKTV